jgi:hypothetical protein
LQVVCESAVELHSVIKQRPHVFPPSWPKLQESTEPPLSWLSKECREAEFMLIHA